jgi:hypothetical protein
MKKSSIARFAALGAGLIAVALPVAATAQDEPTTPEVRELQTGSRIQTITIIGAIRDRRATRRAERPADRRVPELPVTYEDSAQPGR